MNSSVVECLLYLYEPYEKECWLWSTPFQKYCFFGRSMPCTYYIKIGEELVQTENRTGLEA
jgi:hypothetical protein